MRGGGVAVWVDKAILRNGVKRVISWVSGWRVERGIGRGGVRGSGEEEEEERLRRGSVENKKGGKHLHQSVS